MLSADRTVAAAVCGACRHTGWPAALAHASWLPQGVSPKPGGWGINMNLGEPLR